ncbi:Toll/interleukin-1 receptor domain-containing protein [Tanacetum coccineum]
MSTCLNKLINWLKIEPQHQGKTQYILSTQYVLREDTRKTFVDHLYSLEQRHIRTYKDDITLPRGESVGPTLLKAIQESRHAVIIFSKNYADSSWCLDELVHIMKCRAENGQIVMPVFHDVDPSDVRKQRGDFEKAFSKQVAENTIKAELWRKQLIASSNISGWEPKNIANGHESMAIKKIVDTIFGGLFPLNSDIDEGLLFIKQKRGDFGKAFSKQVAENTIKAELWRKQLIAASNISGWEPKNIANGHESMVIKKIVDTIFGGLFPLNSDIDEGLVGMRARLQDLISQLKIGSDGVRMVGIWGLGGGGKTTLATSVYMEIIRHFKSHCIIENIREESRKFGLKKLQGDILSALYKTKIEVYSVAEGKRKIKSMLCHSNVLVILDDVDDLDQLEVLAGSPDWFGDGSRIIITTRDEHLLRKHKVDHVSPVRLLSRDEAMWLFNSHAYNEEKHIKDYEKLSLQVVSYADGLPLALKVLGSFLYDKDAIKHVGCSTMDRRRDFPKVKLWEMKSDAMEIFQGNILIEECGIDAVSLTCILGDANRENDQIEAIDFNNRIDLPHNDKIMLISKMKKLRWLRLIGDNTGNGEAPNCLSNELRYIEWDHYPANQFPDSFQAMNLIFLTLFKSKQKLLWKGYKLRMFPTIVRMEQLESLYIRYCHESLVLPEIQANMECLVKLDVSDIEIDALLSSIGECCTNLIYLNLVECFNLNSIEVKFDELKCLKEFSGSKGREKTPFPLPLTCSLRNLSQLTRLKLLNLSGCRRLVKLPVLPSNIAIIKADECDKLTSIGDLSENCKWLCYISLDESTVNDGNRLLQSMLKGNASKNQSMHLKIRGLEIPKQFTNRLYAGAKCRLPLPVQRLLWIPNWRCSGRPCSY